MSEHRGDAHAPDASDASGRGVEARPARLTALRSDAGAPGDRRDDAGRILRVATYNVHACVGTDRRHDPERVASVVSELNADIVALQEFTYPASVAIESREPVELVSLDSYQCALGPTRQTQTRCFGNALLTRHPIVDVHRLDLSMDRREPRGALAATVDVDGTHVHVLATHLGLRVHERRFQVRQIVSYLESVRHSLVVVLGDFNDWLPGRSVGHVLDLRLGRAARLRSFPSSRPMLSLDRIWIQPAATLRRMFVHTSALARRASDHLPVVAELDLTDATAVGLTGALAAGQTDASTTGLANASAAGSISR